MKKASNSLLAIFTNYALFEIFLLGVLSGMPFAVILNIFMAMVKDLGVGIAIATSLALAKVPYSAKFLWSPFIDGLKIPFLSKFGKRKSWMMLVTMINIVLLSLIISIASKANFSYILGMAICFGFFSASYDIAYDGWRIERVSEEMQAMCASVAVFAYRIGVFVINIGVMYIVGLNDNNWLFGFSFIISTYILLFLFLLTVQDKNQPKKAQKLGFDFQNNVIDPFKDFLTKPNAILILLAIIFYKAGEAMVAFVTMPFIFDLGFTKIEWVNVSKIFGFWITTLGTFTGGVVVYKLGPLRGLLFCGIIQMLANLTYIWLGSQGPVMMVLYITIVIDNFTGGMGMAALVGYLGTLCNREYTATQYALFSSATAFANSTIIVYSGTLVEKLGWSNFFIFTVILSLPALFILIYLIQKGRKAK